MTLLVQYDLFSLFALDRARALAMEVEQTTLTGLQIGGSWTVTEDAILRPDGRFFRVVGLNVTRAAGREVSGWRQPAIVGDEAGTIGLILAEKDGEQCVLLRMKGEPGNTGIKIDGVNSYVLASPALQFSASNLEHHARARAGLPDDRGIPCKPVPLADLVSMPGFLWEDGQPEDGGRFCLKWNRYGVLDLGSDPAAIVAVEAEVAALPNNGAADFAWVSIAVLRTARKQGILNSHFRACLSLLV